MTLPLGLVPPVLTAVPGMHSDWERTADVDTFASLMRSADSLGYDHVTCSEHVAVPTAVAAQRGGTYWDPLATLSYLACATSRLRLVTYVLVLAYHHPLAIAKRYGTLDRLSGGRLVLGLGVGSLEDEFALLGAPWQDRGARADDAVSAIRAALSKPHPRYAGTHYAFDDVVVEPTAVQQRVPMWMGGRTLASLERAVRSADGWAPFGLGFRAVSDMLSKVVVPAGFEVLLGLGPLQPDTDPAAVERILERARAAGATRVNASLLSRSPGHYEEQLGALASLAGVGVLS